MSEAFLHYIWKYQYFDKRSLRTTEGEAIDVFNPGFHNTDAGPDFKQASIKIDEMQWQGQVEIHHRSSDWKAHGHHNDEAYNSTVLHVVWKDDKEVQRADGTKMPTVELWDRVDTSLQTKHDKLVKSGYKIPCVDQFGEVNDLQKLSMIEKVVMERLQRKSLEVSELLKANNNNWEETTYQLLARSYGFKKNNEPFFELAKSISYKVIKKHSNNLMQVEALLFGQAGFLNEAPEDDYYRLLKKEYDFLKKKYRLEQKLSKHQWKFLRLRPANFPTIRLAQFAAVLANTSGLFAFFIEADAKTIIDRLRSEVGEYWQTHFTFGKKADKGSKRLGKSGAENLCINTVAPILMAYSLHIDDLQFSDKAIKLLQSLPPEKNHIIRTMVDTGFKAENAFDTQGMIELHNNYCLRKRCLQCNIGAALVRP